MPDELDAVAVGGRIKERREERGYTQRDLGSLVLTSEGKWTAQPVVSGWETGKSLPTAGELAQIAEGMDVSVEWLETGDEP